VQIDVDAATTIGEQSVFEGRFAIRGSLRVDGTFEGQALVVDQLAIGPKGRVRASITATSVVVEASSSAMSARRAASCSWRPRACWAT
jgi:cytoskeletal protein CcmA (bactofilin family)